MRVWKEILHANGNEEKTRVAVLTSDKMDFKIKTIVRDKEEYCVTIEIHLKREVKFVNIGPTKCIEQIGEKFIVMQE